MVRLVESQFDLFTEKTTGKSIPVRLFTWENENKISIQVINYGATIVSIKVPDRNGKIDDLVLGYSNLADYQSANNRFFGATVGRVANRIGQGQFRLNGTIYNVSKNWKEAHSLHGGFQGFDKVIWEPFIDGSRLILSYHAKDGEEGYPGDLVVHTIFELLETNEFTIRYKVTTTKPTVVNMTNHSYFNLAGHNKGAAELYKHVVCLNSDRITEVDGGIPTGNLTPVALTVFDLQVPKVLGDVIGKIPNAEGYDNNFCVVKGPEQGNTFVARVHHPDSGRIMEVYSDQPGVQFYTANFLPETDVNKGKEGAFYKKHGAFCMETQNWPDAPNHDNFPSAVLNPGETYQHYVAYKFSIK